jgi:glycosyltransferase involved in cell wall biosynthesis
MELLINNQEYRQRLGSNGKQYVINNFLSEQITREWLTFYRNLLN